MSLLERCCQVRTIFKLSFDYSFYFDKSAFEHRFGNIFGMTDAMLDKFKEVLDKKIE